MSRDILREIAKNVNASIKIIYIDVSPEVMCERWEDNKINKKRFILDKKLLHMRIDALEIPKTSEDLWILKN